MYFKDQNQQLFVDPVPEFVALHSLVEVTQVEFDSLVAAQNTKPPPERRALSKTSIDIAAGAARGRFITTVPGQEATYQLKADEANAFIAANRPTDTTDYPMLSAEAEGRGVTVSALADEIVVIRALWLKAAAQIEKARVTGKGAIDAAQDDSDFEAVAQPYIGTLNAMAP